MGFFNKLKKIWQEDIMGHAISAADEAFFEDLEEMLILADVGMEVAVDAVEQLRKRAYADDARRDFSFLRPFCLN